MNHRHILFNKTFKESPEAVRTLLAV